MQVQARVQLREEVPGMMDVDAYTEHGCAGSKLSIAAQAAWWLSRPYAWQTTALSFPLLPGQTCTAAHYARWSQPGPPESAQGMQRQSHVASLRLAR